LQRWDLPLEKKFLDTDPENQGEIIFNFVDDCSCAEKCEIDQGCPWEKCKSVEKKQVLPPVL